MSILRVANLQFNASGTRRIDYDSVADDGIVKISAAAVKLPVGDTASRPTSQAGIVRYNSDTGYMEFGGATNWVAVASNVAFDVANAAFASANNVAPQVTPAFLTANLAYTTTNAAFAVANTALQNTSGVSFNGNFNVPNGSITVSGTPAQVNSSFIGLTGTSLSNTFYSSTVNRQNTVSNIAFYASMGQFNQPLLNTNGFSSAVYGSYNIPIVTNSSGTDRVLLYGSLNSALRNSNNDISTATNCIEYGLLSYAGHYNGTNSLSSYTSSISSGIISSSYNFNGTITNMYGGNFQNFIGSGAGYTGSSTNAHGVYTSATVGAASGTGTGTLTNYYDAYLAGVTVNATGTVTNRYGVYQAATNHINYFGGNVGIGTTSPTGKLDVASRGITKGSMPAGSILQVVSVTDRQQSSYTTVDIGTNTNYGYNEAGFDLTTLDIALTPTSTSSKIFILTNINLGSWDQQYGVMRLKRGIGGATPTWSSSDPWMSAGNAVPGTATQLGSYIVTNRATGWQATHIHFQWLDSPNTTSEVKYRFNFRIEADATAATAYLNRAAYNTNDYGSTGAVSSVTLMEVAV